ncbi:MAG: thermonuclease family protein [Clostridia bacterium]|nr:thermonuclease family protein [Clostridia bacterium]
MKKMAMRLLSLALTIAILVMAIAGCAPQADDDTPATPTHVDYAASVKLDMAAPTLKQEVTVKTYIDGDTTHFNVPSSVSSTGVLKARYLGINTPESTGKVEEWGKAASNFTKEKLKAATSIYVESDNAQWNVDSTGGRHLVWVWYKTADDADYRNLNIELLQNGLAIASNTANNRYGEIGVAAIDQARAEKLHVYSGEKDPDFAYGAPNNITLKELRTHIVEYEGDKVAFEGTIVKDHNGALYVEDYDAESEMYFGIYIYYATAGINAMGLKLLAVGNRVRFVGNVQNFNGSYQISGLQYNAMRPDDLGNFKLVSENNEPSYLPTDPTTFANGEVELEVDEEKKTYKYAELVMHTSVSMTGLRVVDVYTTTNESSSSKGAMTLTCEKDGVRIPVRTDVLRDENGEIITEDLYAGETIDVKGLVEYFSLDGEDGQYQIKVLAPSDITIH